MRKEITPLDREHPMVPGGELDPETYRALVETLKDMKSQVKAVLFFERNCYYCEESKKLLDTFVRASPLVNNESMFSYRAYNIDLSWEVARRFGILRTPAIILAEGHIRYFGIPSGEEIRSFVETIIRISEGETGLEEDSKNRLANIRKPIHLETIITPACPYCPYAALLANMIAYQSYLNGNRNIVSDVIEAYENPDIAEKYAVMSVPVIVINEEFLYHGVPYESEFIDILYDVTRRS